MYKWIRQTYTFGEPLNVEDIHMTGCKDAHISV